MKPVRFKYEIGQKVMIEPLELPAVVMARCDRGNGLHDYRVIYWADSQRRDDWLYEYELAKL